MNLTLLRGVSCVVVGGWKSLVSTILIRITARELVRKYSVRTPTEVYSVREVRVRAMFSVRIKLRDRFKGFKG